MIQVIAGKLQAFLRTATRIPQYATAMFVMLFAATASAQVVSSPELINKAKEYDGKTVVYQGEVIGDVMARGDNAWINLNDGKNALGIWIKKDLTKLIAYTGSYKTRCDELEIIGVFHRSCLVHGGDLDIHAESLLRIKDGNKVEEKMSSRRLVFSFVLGATLLLLWISKLSARLRKQK